jgi:hypothetical protein
MEDQVKKALMLEHAQLVAAHASGNTSVIERMQEIEDSLQMTAPAIAEVVVRDYLSDY